MTTIRLNWPLTVLAIAVMLCVTGAWLTLVLTRTITPETGFSVLSHFGTFITGAVLPIVFYERPNRPTLSFTMQSDPPKGAA